MALAHAAEPPRCGTPERLAGPRTEAPARLGGPPTATASGKPIYGNPYSQHLESENFTVNVAGDPVDDALLETTAEALELAWSTFLVEDDWRAPVSSDQYLLWVLLGSLDGYTGYTTEYFSSEFGDGYPVIYLDPVYAWDEAFWEALVAHEFMHAIQYAYRDYDWADEDETWYWEACAMWAEEQALPENDSYAVHSQWYTTQTELRYSSTYNYHAYGMFVLPAYVEEQVGDAASMRESWEDSEARVGDAWSDIVADGLGLDAPSLWAGFTATVGNNGLAESAIYIPVETRGALVDGATGELDQLGSDYWFADAPGEVSVSSGDVFLSGPGGAGTAIGVAVGEVVAVSARDDGVSYQLAFVARDSGMDSDPGDSGDSGDSAEPDPDGAKDSAAGGEDPGGCGCQSGAGALPAGLLALLALRRRS